MEDRRYTLREIYQYSREPQDHERNLKAHLGNDLDLIGTGREVISINIEVIYLPARIGDQ